MKTTISQNNICRNCLKPIDAHSDIEGKAKPKTGSISICAYCCTISIFNKDLSIRQPTPEEMVQLVEDEETWNKILKYQAGLRRMPASR